MKVGIVAALVLVLVAIYFVFGSEFLAPSSSDTVSSKDVAEKGAEGGPGAKAHPRAHQGDGADDSAERELGTSPTNSRDPGSIGETPSAAPASGVGGQRAPGEPSTYTRHDGVVVRDHRKNAPPPDLNAYALVPADVSKVKSSTLMAVQGALRGPVSGCIESHSTEADKGSKLLLSLITSISAETLRVDKARVTISGLPEEAPLRICVEKVAIGQELAVAGHEDVNIHRMVLRYNM